MRSFLQAVAAAIPGRDGSTLLEIFAATLPRRPRKARPTSRSRFHGEPLEDRRMMALGVETVSEISPQALNGPELNGATYYFERELSNNGLVHKLMRTDFSAAGTEVVSTLPSPVTEAYTVGRYAAMSNDLIFFVVFSGHDTQVWRTDGTDGGTFPLTNFDAPGNTWDLDVFHGTAYFTFFPNLEIWKSDGTLAGTSVVTDRITSLGAAPVNDGFVFFGDDLRIWKSDGTDEGTVPISEVRPVGLGDGTSVSSNGLAYFRSHEAPGFYGDLWKSDGTPEGTKLVKDINPGPGYSNPQHMKDLEGRLLFFADDGVNGAELWSSDGSEEGTLPLSSFPPEAAFVHGMTRVGDSVYFTVYLEGGNNQLWRSDGTAAGTQLVEYMHSLPGADVNGVYVFRSGESIWRSEGSPESTYPIADVAGCCGNITSARGTAYFSSDDGRGNITLMTVVRPDGDANLDGDVDLDDLNRVRNHFGESGLNTPGDTNGDGIVDLLDLNAVRNHFGEGAALSGDTRRNAFNDVRDGKDLSRKSAEQFSFNTLLDDPSRSGEQTRRSSPIDAVFDLWPDKSMFSADPLRKRSLRSAALRTSSRVV